MMAFGQSYDMFHVKNADYYLRKLFLQCIQTLQSSATGMFFCSIIFYYCMFAFKCFGIGEGIS